MSRVLVPAPCLATVAGVLLCVTVSTKLIPSNWSQQVPSHDAVSVSNDSVARRDISIARIQCWSRGSWERDDIRAGQEVYANLVLREDQRDPWYWTTPCLDSPMRYYDRTEFCRALRRRHIVLLGDSMNGQLARALLHVAGDGDFTVAQTTGSISMDKFTLLDKRICQNTAFPSGLSMLKNWRLTEEDVPGWEPGLRTFFSAVFNTTSSPLVVLVNRGAHYSPDDYFLSEVERVLYFVTRQPRISAIIWRNTPPGHANCTNYSGPIQSPQAEEGLPFNWGEFRHQNGLVDDMLSSKFPEVWHMDVYSPTVLRPDRHTGGADCLHYHLPSVIFHWARLFYNVLAEISI